MATQKYFFLTQKSLKSIAENAEDEVVRRLKKGKRVKRGKNLYEEVQGARSLNITNQDVDNRLALAWPWMQTCLLYVDPLPPSWLAFLALYGIVFLSNSGLRKCKF